VPYRIAAPEPPKALALPCQTLTLPEYMERALGILRRGQLELELIQARHWAEVQERMFQRRLRVAKGGSWKDSE
jgi:hypothetical protein